MSRTDPTIYMRIPADLKKQLDEAATSDSRSLTSEVVSRLRTTLAAPNTTTAPTGQIAPFGLRMLPDLRDRVEQAARTSGRSMNAEIVARLNSSFAATEASANGGMVPISAELHAALVGLLKAAAP